MSKEGSRIVFLMGKYTSIPLNTPDEHKATALPAHSSRWIMHAKPQESIVSWVALFEASLQSSASTTTKANKTKTFAF